MTLAVRTAERGDGGSLIVTLDRVNVTCALDTGHCTASDDATVSFVAEQP